MQGIAAVGGDAGRDVPIIQLYEIAGISLRVPAGFLRPIELPPEAGVRQRNRIGDSIEFHAIAPDLAPPPPGLREHWKGGNGYPPYVSFSISVVRPDIIRPYRSKIMRKEIEAGRCAAMRKGDLCPDPRELWAERSEVFFTGIGQDFVFCDKWRSVPAPHCDSEFFLLDGVFVDAFFDRRILDFSDPVWERIYDLVCSWIDLPSDRALTINRCLTTGGKRPN